MQRYELWANCEFIEFLWSVLMCECAFFCCCREGGLKRITRALQFYIVGIMKSLWAPLEWQKSIFKDILFITRWKVQKMAPSKPNNCRCTFCICSIIQCAHTIFLHPCNSMSRAAAVKRKGEPRDGKKLREKKNNKTNIISDRMLANIFIYSKLIVWYVPRS